MEQKAIWKSKTFWVNMLAIGGMLIKSEFGVELSAEATVGILSIINIVLRVVTKDPVGWK